MAKPDFDIEIIEQGWICYESADFDKCSHGKIILNIGGQVILDGTEDYGISESALAMLRTLDSDHTEDKPVAERIILHGCGCILMMSCPIGINWEVRHEKDAILLKNVIKYDTVDEKKAIKFPGLQVKISFADYCERVTNFARKAKQPFQDDPRTIFDRDEQLYLEFWDEYGKLLNQYTSH